MLFIVSVTASSWCLIGIVLLVGVNMVLMVEKDYREGDSVVCMVLAGCLF